MKIKIQMQIKIPLIIYSKKIIKKNIKYFQIILMIFYKIIQKIIILQIYLIQIVRMMKIPKNQKIIL